MVVYNSVSQTDPDTQRIIAYPKGGGVYLPSRVWHDPQNGTQGITNHANGQDMLLEHNSQVWVDVYFPPKVPKFLSPYFSLPFCISLETSREITGIPLVRRTRLM